MPCQELLDAVLRQLVLHFLILKNYEMEDKRQDHCALPRPCGIKHIQSKEEDDMGKEALNALLDKDLIIGYVYRYDGGQQSYYFEKSPSNITNFIILNREHAEKVILTDLADRLVLNTFGEFINRCPDQELLQEILKDLIPMQMGEKEPTDILSASEEEFQEHLDEKERNVMEAELRML